ncbi:MAG: isopeptide-forming domain-containing fimbrial protein [Cyanobacteria bacterium]|nr:isopeptide-forming domain-containing fimbrial protein [Cyanobacteriota bacterium]
MFIFSLYETTLSFGDAKGLDLWTYFPSSAQATQVIIVPSSAPQVNAVKYVELVADTDGSGTLTGGDRIRYTIIYNNIGTAAAAGFQIADMLPTDVTFVTASMTVVATGAGTIAAVNAGYNGTTVPNLLAANAVLGINGTIKVTIDATINGTATGDLFNQAKGTSTSPGYPTGGILTDTRDSTTTGIPNTSIDQSVYPTGTPIDRTGITIVTPKPLLNKSVRRLRDNDGSGTLTPGDDVKYTIVLRNPNPVAPIQNVVVSDAIPTQLRFLTDAANLVTVTSLPFVPATTLPTADFNGDGTTPIALTNAATLAPGASVTVTFNAKILAGAASPIANQALVNFKGDLGKPVRSDASNSTAPSAPGSGANPGTPDVNGDVTQPDSGPDDTTILNIVSLVNPLGTKSVRLFDDKDGSGSVSIGDVVEYTVIYRNTTSTDVTGFQITDTIETANFTFVPGSYTFAKSAPATTVPAQSNYDGSTVPEMTGTGTLAANSSVTITFRATIIAANTVIRNQASAIFSGSISPSLTDAISGPRDEPQVADDGANTGNIAGNTGDDEPNLLTVKGPGEARLKLVKRITGATRNGVTIAGLNFNQDIKSTTDSSDDIRTAGLTPFGLLELSALTPLRSGDETEYTIYFLSDGQSFAQNVALCDLIPTGTTFLPNSFGSQQGITLRANNATTIQTNATGDDPSSFLPSLAPLPAPNGCINPANPNGAAIVQLGTLTNLSPGNVGFFRFRVRVN